MEEVVKRIGTVDLDRIKAELALLPEFSTQIILQAHEADIKDYTFGTHAVKTLNGVAENKFTHNIFDLPYINQLITQYGLFRTRVMRMYEKSCYSYHTDFTPRLHIPVVSNENCFFVIDDIVYKLPADGSIYLVNTTLPHTFVNASWFDRTHIVGCLSDTDEKF